MNSHVEGGRRIALAGWSGYPYFLDSQHLVNSESAQELQWLWENHRRLSFSSQTTELWRFYQRNGFSYVVLSKEHAERALASWSSREKQPPQIVFRGRRDVVLKLETTGKVVG
jgi:hypothetical protein